MRYVAAFVVAAAIAGGLAWVLAGRGAGPSIAIDEPASQVGQATPLVVTITSPDGTVTALEAALEQGGATHALFSLASAGAPGQAGTGAAGGMTFTQAGPDTMRLTGTVGRKTLPALKTGPATLSVTASRAALFGLRTLSTRVEKPVQVRLEPPRVAVLSTHHYVNHGGAEFVVYRATPEDVTSGVRVGSRLFPGYPGSGAGLAADPTLRVAFFALPYDEDLATPIDVVARDAGGNEATARLDSRVFPKAFRRSRIEVTAAFLQRVVPEIAARTPDLKVETDGPNLERGFLAINGDLRRKNAEQIAALARKTAPEKLWRDAFQQLGNSAVESAFADHRTYLVGSREIDQQVHLGFDLAVTAAVPIAAANRGVVVFADWLGIYGNSVVLDHGLGVQSLYAHLSTIDVKAGETVERGQTLGRSGMTGLAGGDHLHFTMLVDGVPVNPVEWWDPHWIQDRVVRKLREAGASTP